MFYHNTNSTGNVSLQGGKRGPTEEQDPLLPFNMAKSKGGARNFPTEG